MRRDLLVREGHAVGRKHVATLMRRMGIEALYRKPNTSRRHAVHPIYPYLHRNVAIERPNHVWAMDITYVPMARGYVYLAAVMDWFSRHVLAWSVSISMDAAFCIEALEEAMRQHDAPQIVNTDQGTQFTSEAFTGVLRQHGIAISMDGRGCWRDKAYVSHCTSFAGSETTLGSWRLRESLVPCALHGESAPGGSYRHSFLSL